MTRSMMFPARFPMMHGDGFLRLRCIDAEMTNALIAWRCCFVSRVIITLSGDFPSAASFRDTVLAGNSIQGFKAMSDREFKRKLAILDDVLQRELPHISSMEEK